MDDATYQWVRNVSFLEKFCIRTKWMTPKLLYSTLKDYAGVQFKDLVPLNSSI